MQHRLAAAMPDLSPAERKVAATIAANPAAAARATTSQLARAAGVSEPTIVRFCRSLGFGGLGDLRLALVQQDNLPARMHRRIAPGTPVSEAAGAVLDTAIAALESARRHLDAEPIERAALALVRAARVELWGFGASAAVAADMEHKLFRVCRGVTARADPHMQAMAAATLDGDSAAICISHTGRTREIVDAARLARCSGATVIAITAPGSPLAAEATILLGAQVEEDTSLHVPMVSRLVHLALGDALAVAVALLSPPAAEERLARMKAALKPRRLD